LNKISVCTLTDCK